MNAFSEKTKHSEVLSLQDTSKIFCMKAIIVVCLYGFSNSESVHSYEQREQATKQL